MQPASAWTAELAVGIDEIDRQHQELFRRVASLVDALARGEGKEVVEPIFRFLEAYSAEHFADEERWMEGYGYPGRFLHVLQHRRFVVDLVEIRRRLDTHGPTAWVTLEVHRVCVAWLREHIRGSDATFAEFLGTRRVRAPMPAK